jgi:hypothetical protein
MISRTGRAVKPNAPREQCSGLRPLISRRYQETLGVSGSTHELIHQPTLLCRPRSGVEFAGDNRREPHLAPQNRVKQGRAWRPNGLDERRGVGDKWTRHAVARSETLLALFCDPVDSRWGIFLEASEHLLEIGKSADLVQAFEGGHHILGREGE